MSFTCASTSTAAATVRCIAGMAFPTNQVWPLQPLLIEPTRCSSEFVIE